MSAKDCADKNVLKEPLVQLCALIPYPRINYTEDMKRGKDLKAAYKCQDIDGSVSEATKMMSESFI